MSNQTKQTRLLHFYNPLNCFNASDDSAAVARMKSITDDVTDDEEIQAPLDT